VSDEPLDPFNIEDEDAREERVHQIARLFGTTPNHISGITVAARAHAQATPEDTNANGWVPIGPRNVGGAIRCLAIRTPTAAERAQRLPLHLAAGSAGGGLWISTTGGYTWQPAGLPHIVGAVGAVAWSAVDRRVLYAATGDIPLGYPGGFGFFKSVDAGQSFTQLVDAAGGDGAAAHYAKIALDPKDAHRAWVASDTGLWRLEGTTFRNEVIPGVAAGTTMTDVEVTSDPMNPNQCFILVGIHGI
jgi:hypothetical protein